MRWEVEGTDEFVEWWEGLNPEQQDALDNRIALLEEQGPDLGTPYVERIVSSRVHSLKELRCSSLRVLFTFDPRRAAILLLGGDKSGQWKAWYEESIPQAEALYEQYLDELRAEGLL